jgi:hypothetical protein
MDRKLHFGNISPGQLEGEKRTVNIVRCLPISPVLFHCKITTNKVTFLFDGIFGGTCLKKAGLNLIPANFVRAKQKTGIAIFFSRHKKANRFRKSTSVRTV